MKGRELWQSVEKDFLLPLSNAVVQMLGHGDRTQRVIDDLGRLQVLLGDDGLRKVAVGPFRLGSSSVSDDDVGALSICVSFPLCAFSEVFLLDGPCLSPSEGCDLNNSGRVERGLRTRRGDRATERSCSDTKGQRSTSDTRTRRNLRITAALNIVVGIARNSRSFGQGYLPN